MSATDFNINISTTAKLQGLKELETSLRNQAVAAKALGDTDGYEKFGRQLRQVQQQLGQFSLGQKITGEVVTAAQSVPILGSAMNVLNGSLGPVSLALGTFAVGLGLARRGLNEYAAAQEAVADLDASLAAQGKLTDSYREKLQDLAAQLSETTAIADDEWLGVLGRLSKFGADESNIDRYAEAVKNLAGVTGGSVQEAANAFSRALAGNFTQLSRLGIVLPEMGTKAEKLDAAMRQLAERGGGVLEARASTLNGAFKSLGIATGEFFESVGSRIPGVSNGVMAGFLRGAADGVLVLAEMINGGPIPALEGLRNKARAAGATLEEEVGGATLKTAQENVDALAKKLDGVTEAARRARQAKDELEDSKLGLALAEMDLAEQKALASAVTPEDRKQVEFSFRGKREQLRQTRTLARAGDDLTTATTARDATQGELESMDLQERNRLDRLARLRSTMDQWTNPTKRTEIQQQIDREALSPEQQAEQRQRREMLSQRLAGQNLEVDRAQLAVQSAQIVVQTEGAKLNNDVRSFNIEQSNKQFAARKEAVQAAPAAPANPAAQISAAVAPFSGRGTVTAEAAGNLNRASQALLDGATPDEAASYQTAVENFLRYARVNAEVLATVRAANEKLQSDLARIEGQMQQLSRK
jgi:hypothetical protein